jgi:flagellar FliL protein
VPMVIAGVTGAFLAFMSAVGFGYYLLRTGRLEATNRITQRVPDNPSATTHVMVLDPLLANLADPDGSGYVRVSLTLSVENAGYKNGAKAKTEGGKDEEESSKLMAEARDTVLTILGRQTADQLLANGGKERLKAQLKAGLAERDPDLKIVDIFFTDFLVQR